MSEVIGNSPIAPPDAVFAGLSKTMHRGWKGNSCVSKRSWSDGRRDLDAPPAAQAGETIAGFRSAPIT